MAVEPLPPLLGRKKLVSLGAETTSGTFTTPSLIAANLYNIKCDAGEFFKDGVREPDGNYLGQVASILGKQMGTLSFEMDCAPTGPLLSLIPGAGYLNTTGTLAPSSNMATRSNFSGYVYEDGIRKKMAGMACKCVLSGEDGKKLTAKFDWSGIWGGVTDNAMPSQAPIATAPYMVLGITLTLGGAAIAKCSKFSIDLGAEVEEREDFSSITTSVGIAHYMVGDILPKITLDPEARKVADQDAYGAFLAGTTAALVIALAGGGHTLTITAPLVQRAKVTRGDRGKKATHDLELICCNSSGDDALTFVES